MEKFRLGVVESQFADIVWQNAPLSTKELIKLCEQALNWKRTTTYTVLKKLCEKGIFKMENSTVTVLMEKDEFSAIRSENFVHETFGGSLPAFVAAFTSRKKLSGKDLAELRKLINSIEEK